MGELVSSYCVMDVKTLKLSIPLTSLDMLQEVVSNQIKTLRGNTELYQSGELSLGDFGNYDTNMDLEFHTTVLKDLEKRIKSTQYDNERNEVEYLQQHAAFRPDEFIECVRLSKRDTTRVVYIFHSRHGVLFFCSELIELIGVFTQGKDPNRRFGCRAELEVFLSYC